MTYSDTVKFLVAMFIMMNPLGSLSVFLQLTDKYSMLHQKQTALRCSIAVFIIMLITIWLGKQLLDLLGITIPSFRFAGGIIMLLVGLSMLQAREIPVRHPATDENNLARHSIALVPMALPIIIGPGSISTLVLASNDYALVSYKVWLSILCLLLAFVIGFILYYCGTVAKLVGESVIKMITRIMGMLIMAIAVGMLANGLMGLFPGLS